MGQLSEVDNQIRMIQIIDKLPFFLQTQWRKHAVKFLNEHGRYPNISNLAEFIEIAAQEATDPVFGWESSTHGYELRSGTNRLKSREPKGTIFNVQAINENQRSQYPITFSCHYCSKGHSLLKCLSFQDLTPEKRFNFIRDNHLCFNCFSPKHMVYNCPKDSRCSVQTCDKHHSGLLHEYFQHQNTSNVHVEQGSMKNNHVSLDGLTFHSIGPYAVNVALPVVPVKIQNINNQYIETYALLDSGSTNTFCSLELLQLLGIAGHKTSLSLTTIEGQKQPTEVKRTSLHLTDIKGRQSLDLPTVFATSNFPTLQTSFQGLERWPHLADIPFHKVESKVMLIIGQDIPEALLPLEVRSGNPGQPYATKTILGWTLNGPLMQNYQTIQSSCNFITVDKTLTDQVEKFWKIDCCLPDDDLYENMSENDRKVVELWKSSTLLKDNHYQIKIPFRNPQPILPNNYAMAENRLLTLGRKLLKNESRLGRYKAEIDNLLEDGYAEKVTFQNTLTQNNPSKIWYLPHFSVTNVNKPEKLRLVFDCAAQYNGISLNSSIYQGPDLTNKLLGVLLRFRQERVAILGDIQAMFHQVRVVPEDRDVLRFLWWKNGNPREQVEIYRMTVHLFGGVWSPSCASYALNLTATENAHKYHPMVSETVHNNFYVDDCLKSIKTSTQAIKLIHELCSLLKEGGFTLNKLISNDKAVLESIPVEHRSSGVQSFDFDKNSLPTERALGVRWDVEADRFGYKISLRERPYTRRGLLSIMSSVYDPLGFVSPFIFLAKRIFQTETKRKKQWDCELETNNLASWKKWLENLPKLEKFWISRCILPKVFGKVTKAELHHFADASCEGYGVTSYIRLEDDQKNTHCTLVTAKSRLAPIKTLTIPRLELTAAVLATKMDVCLRKELDICLDPSTIWTDSEIVLRYIHNQDKRFQTFVANRLSVIHQFTKISQWKYVSSSENPADDASRGLDADSLLSSARWKKGPTFLWQKPENWPQQPTFNLYLPTEDLEIKPEVKIYQAALTETQDPVVKLITSYSSWYRLKKAVAWLHRLKSCLLNKCKQKLTFSPKLLTVPEIQEAEVQIIKFIQRQYFSQELKDLHSQNKSKVQSSSTLIKLEPFQNVKGILCVGGRLQNAPIPTNTKHQFIIPKNHHVGSLIINHFHHMSGHSGREHVLAALRQRFWIIGGRRQVERNLKDCVSCERRQKRPEKQRMVDLPEDRVTPFKPPFSYIGTDCFGPISVRKGRSQVKRYGCLFTCLSSRAVHIEKLDSLNTDSFICGLRRFESRRGRPLRIRSDNGTNFTSGEKELRLSIQEWNQEAIANYLLQREIEWIFNPPAASHMGGSWERQIRTVRKVLNALLKKDQSLDDESLVTLFCEVESIVNNRPITVVSNDPKDLEPLTPNSLLILNSVPAFPCGVFTVSDFYRKQWRHVQHLANVFWKRWIREYLPTVQFRQKWLVPQKNFKVGDVVLVLDENTPRGNWPLGKVTQVFAGKDGLVRSVEVKTKQTFLTRPIHKLCLLESITN